jgi:hypothetical protein
VCVSRYTSCLQRVANWYQIRHPNVHTILDARAQSSAAGNEWDVFHNYYDSLRVLDGAGLVVLTGAVEYAEEGANELLGYCGFNNFFQRSIASTVSPVVHAHPLMTFPVSVSDELPGQGIWFGPLGRFLTRSLPANNIPGFTPLGAQPNGRVLHAVAYHEGSDKASVSTTIPLNAHFQVKICGPTLSSPPASGTRVCVCG